MDKPYLFLYILSLVCLIVFLLVMDIEPWNYIMFIIVGTLINIMAIFHFNNREVKG